MSSGFFPWEQMRLLIILPCEELDQTGVIQKSTWKLSAHNIKGGGTRITIPHFQHTRIAPIFVWIWENDWKFVSVLRSEVKSTIMSLVADYELTGTCLQQVTASQVRQLRLQKTFSLSLEGKQRNMWLSELPRNSQLMQNAFLWLVLEEKQKCIYWQWGLRPAILFNLFRLGKGDRSTEGGGEVLFPQQTASGHPLLWQSGKGGTSLSYDGLHHLAYQMVIVRLKWVSCLENNPLMKCYYLSIILVWYSVVKTTYARLCTISEDILSSCYTTEAIWKTLWLGIPCLAYLVGQQFAGCHPAHAVL